jgi:hypothetical protein
LPAQHIGQGIELDADTRLPHRLGGLNEGATHIAILDQAIGEGDTAGLGVANRRGDAGIGNADHNVGLHRRFARQHFTDPHPIAVERLAKKAAIGAGEVNHLEDAEPGGLFSPAVALGRGIPVAEMHDLAGLHIAVERRHR